MADPRPCTVCRQTFHPARSDARYCSSRCRSTANSRRRRGSEPREQLQPGQKRCGGPCQQVKPVSEFHWLNGQRRRYQSYCRPCVSRYERNRKLAARGLPEDYEGSILGPIPQPEGHTFVHRRGGYVLTKCSGHHRADRYGYVYEHILVAEAKYGIALTREYTVHHRNRDRQDNRPENLELRVGNHGKGGDVMDALLVDADLRSDAVRVLRALGYNITEPST